MGARVGARRELLAIGVEVAAAEAGENIVPACVGAVSAYATVGEIADVLRGVYGTWVPSGTF